MWTLRGGLEPHSALLRPSLVPSPPGRGCSLPPMEQEGAWRLWRALSDPLLHQDLVFDLGDPVRWEYLLSETDKPLLSLTEEEDDGMNDDDDVENLVSL